MKENEFENIVYTNGHTIIHDNTYPYEKCSVHVKNVALWALTVNLPLTIRVREALAIP